MRTNKLIGVAAAAAIALGTAACGAGASPAALAPVASSSPSGASSSPGGSGSMSTSPSGGVFGPGCATLSSQASTPGSHASASSEPVATAAATYPQLSTLVAAIKQADLAGTLNSANGLTVFAPVNAAFGKVPQATLQQLLANPQQLKSLLEYHVVPQRLAPAQLAGAHMTLQGTNLSVSGSGNSFTVNGTAAVVCGNVQTANATVYLIDGVLMPQ